MPTIEQARLRGHREALFECWEYGDATTPEGGWHALLIQRVGVRGVCAMLGGDPLVERNGWSDEMRAKFAAYDEGASQGVAEYLQDVADADAAGEGVADADFKDPYDSP